MKQSIKINSSFYKKMEILDEYVEEYVSDQLIDIAQTAVNLSPVDTGAYVPHSLILSVLVDQGVSPQITDLRNKTLKL